MYSHEVEADRLLNVGREKVPSLRAADQAGRTERADALGKQLMGIWAQAQVEATLFVGEQLRVSNLIARQASLHVGVRVGDALSKGAAAEFMAIELQLLAVIAVESSVKS